MEPEQPSHPDFVSNSKRFLFTRIFTKANQWNQYFGNWYSFKHCSGDSNPTNTCQFIDPKHRKWRKRMPICLRSTKTMYLLTYLIPVSFFSLSSLWQRFFFHFVLKLSDWQSFFWLWKCERYAWLGFWFVMLVEVHLAQGNTIHISNEETANNKWPNNDSFASNTERIFTKNGWIIVKIDMEWKRDTKALIQMEFKNEITIKSSI